MSDPVDLGILQFVGGWRMLCAAAPGYHAVSGPRVEHIFTGVPIPFFNVSIVTGRGYSAAALQDIGRSACEWAAPHGVSWMFVVTQEALDPGVDAVATLDACGLAPLMTLTGMVARDVAPAPVPHRLELRIAGTDADCEAALDVNASAYDMTLEAANPTWGRRAFWKDHSLALGCLDGRPVSAAAAMRVDGYRYVALVATVPAWRRRGYADAVMRHALDASRRDHGDCPTFLHATDAGRPIYERMGYQPVSTHYVFFDKRFLKTH